MTRGRTGAQVAADTADHSAAVVLVELLFDSGALRLALAPWDIVVGPDVYTASGALLQVESHGEAADGTEGLTLTMSGLEPGILPLVVSEPYRGRVMRLLELRFDADHAPVGVPTVEFVGRMTALSSAEEPAERVHTVSLTVEHFDADARRPAHLRFTDAEQRKRFADDRGAEYVAALVGRVLSRAPKG